MANSTTPIDTIASNQGSKEVTANAYFDAASPATFFGRRASTCSGLVWGYYGGNVTSGGVLTQIAAGTITLTASATNYLETDSTGTLYKNTTAFTAGRYPLYSIVCSSSAVTSYTDYRVLGTYSNPRASVSMTSDANVTLTQAQGSAMILDVSSTVSLTVTRNVVLPLAPMQWTVFNNTTGAQSLQFIGASGTGVTVASGKRAIIYSDGTNIQRVTPDT